MLLPVVNSLKRPTIFPHLTELHLLYKGRGFISDARLGQAIQDVVLLRKGKITHLTTVFCDADVMRFLRDQIPYLKVRYPLVHDHWRLIL